MPAWYVFMGNLFSCRCARTAKSPARISSDIIIGGTVFGGGEANASGSEIYDFTFISVTKGMEINIDGLNHNNFTISGSIFGSGNASSTKGFSYINIFTAVILFVLNK